MFKIKVIKKKSLPKYLNAIIKGASSNFQIVGYYDKEEKYYRVEEPGHHRYYYTEEEIESNIESGQWCLIKLENN